MHGKVAQTTNEYVEKNKIAKKWMQNSFTVWCICIVSNTVLRQMKVYKKPYLCNSLRYPWLCVPVYNSHNV